MHFSVPPIANLFPCLFGLVGFGFLGFCFVLFCFFGLISPLCTRISSLACPPRRAQCVVLEVVSLHLIRNYHSKGVFPPFSARGLPCPAWPRASPQSFYFPFPYWKKRNDDNNKKE